MIVLYLWISSFLFQQKYWFCSLKTKSCVNYCQSAKNLLRWGEKICLTVKLRSQNNLTSKSWLQKHETTLQGWGLVCSFRCFFVCLSCLSKCVGFFLCILMKLYTVGVRGFALLLRLSNCSMQMLNHEVFDVYSCVIVYFLSCLYFLMSFS